ncbi:MAG: hypothetical protein ACMZHY_02170 [Enterobacterales bacterium]
MYKFLLALYLCISISLIILIVTKPRNSSNLNYSISDNIYNYMIINRIIILLSVIFFSVSIILCNLNSTHKNHNSYINNKNNLTNDLINKNIKI